MTALIEEPPGLFVSLTKRRKVSLVREDRPERPELEADLINTLVDAWHDRYHGGTTFSVGSEQDDFREFVAFRVADGDTEVLYFCTECEGAIHEDDSNSHGDKNFCESCWEDFTTCDDCHDLTDRDEVTMVVGEEFVCESCLNKNYSCCTYCDKWHPDDDVTAVGDSSVCNRRCRPRYCSFCDDCDEWYHDNTGCGVDHSDDDEDEDDDGCCSSPATWFTVQNNGDGLLWNDTRASVSLPTGIIDEQGISRIVNRLIVAGLSYRCANVAQNLDHRWQTKDGNFTKRLSRAIYQKDGTKLPADVVSAVGNIAREHASTTASFSIEVTRNLNLSARAFGHSDSCWWQSYYASRCALKSNGGYGLRTFDRWGEVSGRAWVLPLKHQDMPAEPAYRGGCACGCEHREATPAQRRLLPTFDTETPDAFVVFNGYGELSGYVACRIVAHMAGMTYRKIDFQCSPMYVNGESGYLIAPEELAAQYSDGSLYLNVEQHARLYHAEQAAAREAARIAAARPKVSLTKSNTNSDTTSEVSYA